MLTEICYKFTSAYVLMFNCAMGINYKITEFIISVLDLQKTFIRPFMHFLKKFSSIHALIYFK